MFFLLVFFLCVHFFDFGVLEVPLEKMMVETDSPYLSPKPHRGKKNEPAYVVHVAEKIAELKEMSLEEVAQCTTNTALGLFKKLS